MSINIKMKDTEMKSKNICCAHCFAGGGHFQRVVNTQVTVVYIQLLR